MKWMGRGPYRVWKTGFRERIMEYGTKSITIPLPEKVLKIWFIRNLKDIMPICIGLRSKAITTPIHLYSRMTGIFFHVFTPEEPKRTRKKTPCPKFLKGIYPSCWTSRLFAPLNQLSNKGRTASRVISVSNRGMKDYTLI